MLFLNKIILTNLLETCSNLLFKPIKPSEGDQTEDANSTEGRTIILNRYIGIKEFLIFLVNLIINPNSLRAFRMTYSVFIELAIV